MKEKVPIDWTIPKEGAYLLSSTIGISKGTKHLDLAYRYINFVLESQTQALLAKHNYLGPSLKMLRSTRASSRPIGRRRRTSTN
jgi:putative spermidine/putrescine transport system substrate-binding protein